MRVTDKKKSRPPRRIPYLYRKSSRAMGQKQSGGRGPRNEVNLSEGAIATLTELARLDNRKLKNYMEKILEDYAKANAKGKKG